MINDLGRDIEWYLERAKSVSGIKSNRKLGAELGISEGAMSHFKTRRVFPSDETMIRLARLAEVDDLVALMDLHIWKAENDDTRAAYTQILKRISCILIPVLISISPAPAFASVKNACDSYEKVVYIMGNEIQG